MYFPLLTQREIAHWASHVLKLFCCRSWLLLLTLVPLTTWAANSSEPPPSDVCVQLSTGALITFSVTGNIINDAFEYASTTGDRIYRQDLAACCGGSGIIWRLDPGSNTSSPFDDNSGGYWTNDSQDQTAPLSGWVKNYTGIDITLSAGSCPCALTVEIIPLPSPLIARGSSVELTASGADSYLWSNGSTDNPLILNNVTSTTTVSVTGTTGTCSGTATLEISVVDGLTLATAVAPASSICAGSEATLSVTATGGVSPYSYYWEAPEGADLSGPTDQSTVTAIANNAGVYTYTATVYSADNGPVSSNTVSLTVNAVPSVSIGASPGFVVGNGDSITLTATTEGGLVPDSYQWSANAGSGNQASVVVNTADTYSVTAIRNGCLGSSSVSVSVLPCSLTLTTAALTACAGNSVQLSASASTGSIDWYDAPTGGTLLGNSASGSVFSFIPASTTTVYAQLNTATTEPSSQTFTFTEAPEEFTVPAGVTKLHVLAKGAGANGGGQGGIVEADLAVVPGQVLTVYVGGKMSGYNGGGSGSRSNGGGATDIRLGGTTLAHRVLVVGGAGGGSADMNAGTYPGGNGGGLTGQDGQGGSGFSGGKGGTQSAGGTGGNGEVQMGTGGSLGQGGSGISGNSGGGGGGYYGGGSGGHNMRGAPVVRGTGAGGGGSSYTDPTFCTNVSHTQGGNVDDGSLVLTWVAASACTHARREPVAITVGSLTITANPSLTIANGGSVTLTASGANSYTWSNGYVANPLVISNVTSTSTLSVTGATGSCLSTASTNISLLCDPSRVARATSVTQTAVLGPDNCLVQLVGRGYGTGYTITGPGGYVFSAVYRRVGYYSLQALDVKLPGEYHFEVNYTNECGETSQESMTYIVTGVACR